MKTSRPRSRVRCESIVVRVGHSLSSTVGARSPSGCSRASFPYNRPMLTRALTSDLEPYITLLEHVAATLTAAGIRQWLPGSMRAQMPHLRRALENGELFVVRKE